MRNAYGTAFNGLSLRVTHCALLIALFAGSAQAATYYVDYAGGSDANGGTGMGSAWQHSPGDAMATGAPKTTVLAPGDRVIFKGGVVYRGSIDITASGAAGRPITFEGGSWGAQPAIIDGSVPLTNWTACQSQSDCQGNPHWQSIYYTVIPSTPIVPPYQSLFA
jgi:hypothetical protein